MCNVPISCCSSCTGNVRYALFNTVIINTASMLDVSLAPGPDAGQGALDVRYCVPTLLIDGMSEPKNAKCFLLPAHFSRSSDHSPNQKILLRMILVWSHCAAFWMSVRASYVQNDHTVDPDMVVTAAAFPALHQNVSAYC